jgi:hypothetical protein
MPPQPREHAVGREAIVKRTITPSKVVIPMHVPEPHLLKVNERVSERVGRTHDRPRRVLFEVEVEAAYLVAVPLQVVGEEHQRLAGHGEVEHCRRVVSHHHVGREVEIRDVGVVGHVAKPGSRDPRKVVGRQVVDTQQNAMSGAEPVSELLDVDSELDTSPPLLEHRVVTEGGCVQHNSGVVVNVELVAHALSDGGTLGAVEHVVARVTALDDLAREAKGAAQR